MFPPLLPVCVAAAIYIATRYRESVKSCITTVSRFSEDKEHFHSHSNQALVEDYLYKVYMLRLHLQDCDEGPPTGTISGSTTSR